MQGGRRTQKVNAEEQHPLISVITVVYNRADELEDTILSVINQSFKNIDYIIIDGGSTDGTLNIIKNYNTKIGFWISEPDKGIYNAMNKGINLAIGEWLIFMNAGDKFFNGDVLEKSVTTLTANFSKTFVYGNALVVKDKEKHIQFQPDRHLDLTKSIIHQSMFIKSSFLQSNPYDETYRIMADYDNLLKVSVTSPQAIVYLDQTICIYDKSGVSSKPLFHYFPEYYKIARKRMPIFKFIWFILYIIPRLCWSYLRFGK